MDLRVFFIGSLWQGRGEKEALRENFLKKMRKSKKKHLLCYIENVGANIVRPPT